MNASNAKTPNAEIPNAENMVSPVYVGMRMQSAKTRMAGVGSKLTARLQDDSGEIASWVVFMVTLAIAVAALAGLIETWAIEEIDQLPNA